MGSPVFRRIAHEKEEDGFHHRKTFDDTEMSPSPAPSPWPPTQWPPQHGFESSTRTTSVSIPALSDQAKSTTTPSPTPIQSTTVSDPTSTNKDAFIGVGTPDLGDKGPSHKVMPAVAGVGTVVMLAIIGFFVFFCLRKRKRQRQQQASQAQMQEIKARTQPLMRAQMGTSPAYTQYAAPPSHPAPAALATPQPVILGPIVPGSNGAYYTGIDTSDVMSVHDRNGLGNPFADGDSLNDEPPPPYRPRSLAPMSRNTSLRAPPPAPAITSRTNLIGNHDQSLRSPFADPRDDDAISDISGPTRRNYDGISVVSDMSYQEDPVVIRPNV
ncbi:hypothetical protein K505DRAFT_324091 [Melanomma pulvis-pyrius CBS 109.77]|uniref:Uncharacterized protein n=1 Tax=Melanomma pulvis-pyrius CBS 109.77 TaxID=1314802 RepID=A0A6A6XGG7_9PLEO|nr:hypothetical protein K505DRAFT_324091 [Melanomma pulvis-pyrius CBS 109.77]